jgi:hypothetical protein
MLQHPNQSEYPEYYVPYLSLVPEGNLLQILEENLTEIEELFKGISEEDGQFRYAPNKWSIKEVLCHMADTERVMAYRLLRIGRGDQTPLAGFNEGHFVEGSQASQLPIQNILDDFVAVRKASITLIQNMPKEAWANIGQANQKETTARAFAYIIAGHSMHHMKTLNERYFVNLK